MSPSTELLKEVNVKYKILEQIGDTISFSVAAYKGNNDRVIADVLKKLPGIDVKGDGQIYYKNEPIQKYYIEGIDLLEGRYNLANDNLAVDDVSKIDVLENHQPIRILDSLEFSQRASLNIRLKNNVTVSGTASVGVGAVPLLWQLNLTPMIFTKKQQAIITYQSNNTGNDLSREIRDYSINNYEDPYSINEIDWLSIQKLPEPSFSKEFWLNNNSNLGSVNIMQKLKKDVDVKLNISYLNDYQNQDGTIQTSYFTPSDSIEVVENISNNLNLSSLKGKLTLENNTNKNFLKNQLEFNGSWQANQGFIERSDMHITQENNNPFFGIKNDLNFLKKIGKQLVNFQSNTGFTKTNQDLQVQPGQFEKIISEGYQYDLIQQLVSASKIYSHNSIGFTKALGRFTVSPRFGLTIDNQQMDSDILIDEGNQVTGMDFKNRANYLQTSIYFDNSVHFESANNKFKLRFNTPLEIKSFNFKDDNFKKSSKLDKLVFEPNFYAKSKISAYLEVSASSALKYNFGEIQQLYYGFLMEGYRYLNRNDTPISEELNHIQQFSFNYKNPLRQLFLNASYFYSFSKSNLLYSSLIEDNGTIILMAEERDNNFNRHSLNIGSSKFFRKLKTTVKVNASYYIDHREKNINNSITRVSNKNYNLRGSANVEVFNWLVADYSFNFLNYSLGFVNNNIQHTTTNQQVLDLYLYPKENQYLSLSGEFYSNSLSKNNNSFFLNLAYQITFEKPKMDLNISWRNVFCTNSYINTYNFDYYYTLSTYQLRPMQILVSLSLNPFNKSF